MRGTVDVAFAKVDGAIPDASRLSVDIYVEFWATIDP